jgi:hypothetical protein
MAESSDNLPIANYARRRAGAPYAPDRSAITGSVREARRAGM